MSASTDRRSDDFYWRYIYRDAAPFTENSIHTLAQRGHVGRNTAKVGASTAEFDSIGTILVFRLENSIGYQPKYIGAVTMMASNGSLPFCINLVDKRVDGDSPVVGRVIRGFTLLDNIKVVRAASAEGKTAKSVAQRADFEELQDQSEEITELYRLTKLLKSVPDSLQALYL